MYYNILFKIFKLLTSCRCPLANVKLIIASAKTKAGGDICSTRSLFEL